MSKQISIIVTIYNKEKYIENFIKSIINQTYKDYELILVNDGSTDKSEEVLKNVLATTEIDYTIINKANGGQSSARNEGIKTAKGKWIVMLDSDDTIQKDYLKIMVDGVEKNNAEIGICDIAYVKENDIFQESKRTNKTELKLGKEFFKDFIMHDIEIGPCSLIIKREIIVEKEILFNEKSRYSEEFIFITDLLYNSNNVVHIKEKLYNYCLRKGTVSTGANIDKILNGYKQIEIYSERYKENKNEYEVIYNKYALPRWILATARFTAANLKFEEYKILMEKLEAKEQIRKIFTFPEIKTKLAAILFVFSMSLFYKICKK